MRGGRPAWSTAVGLGPIPYWFAGSNPAPRTTLFLKLQSQTFDVSCLNLDIALSTEIYTCRTRDISGFLFLLIFTCLNTKVIFLTFEILDNNSLQLDVADLLWPPEKTDYLVVEIGIRLHEVYRFWLDL